MSKKLFTLIYGDQIHLAPETKVIPAGALSTLMDLEEVTGHVKNDAENFRDETIQEGEKHKENAFREGYEEGFKQWGEHVARLEEEIKKVHAKLASLVVPVALKAARKIVGREIELNPETIVDIVSSNIKAISQHKKIVIYVNRKDLEIIEKNRPHIKDLFENMESLSIRERNDIEPGGCIIETEIGIINGQMEHRWGILEKAFESLAQPNSPTTKGS